MSRIKGESSTIPSPYEQELIDMSYDEMVERANIVEDNEEIRKLLKLVGEKIHENEEGDVTKD